MAADSLQLRFARTIRRRREEIGLSQEAFADKIGLHRTYVGSVERGERNVSLNNLERIAAGLAAPLSELIAEAEKGVHGPSSRVMRRARRTGP
jgi:transcriptional regulator with XRE-family HTH domain